MAHIASWDLDVVTDRLTLSDEFHHMFGLRPQKSATYEVLLDAVHPDDRAAVDTAYTESVRDGRNADCIEHRVARRDNGAVRVVRNSWTHHKDASGRVVRSVGIVHDITENEEAEQTREHLASLLDATSDFVSTATPEGRLTYLNRSGRRMLGWDEDAELGQRTIADVHPAWVVQVIQDVGIPTAIQRGIWNGETAVLTADGREIPVSQVVMAHRSADGSPDFLSTIIRDISEQKLTEAALRASEERFELAMRGANEGLWDWNRETDEVYYSPRWKTMLGYAEHEVGNRLADWERLLHPDDRDRALDKVRAYLDGQTESYDSEFRMRHKDGHYVDILSRGFGIRDASGKVVRLVGTHVDATELKRVEHAFQEGMERYERLEENVPGMVYCCALHPDGSISFPYVNAGSRELFGIEPEDLMRDASLLSGLIHPDDKERRDQSIRESAATLQPWRQELRHVVDGEVRWYDCVSRPKLRPNGDVVWDGIVLEVTDRKRAEETLRLTQFSVDHAADAAFWITSDARVRYVNQNVCRLLGYTRDEMLRMTVHDFNPDHPPESWPERWDDTKRRGSKVIESVNQAKDGRVIPVEISINFLEFEGREYNVAFVRDISERKRAEEELRLTQFSVDHAAIEILRVEPDGRIQSANEHACRSLGYTREELCQLSVFDIDTTLKREDWAEEREHVDAAGTTTWESVRRRKDGTTFPVEVMVTRVTFEGHEFAITFARDITERIQADEQRRTHLHFLESMERVNRAIQSTGDLEETMGVVLDEVLSIFDSDRAWLLYPCDPDSPSWTVPVERARPECPGAASVGAVIPTHPEMARSIRSLLASDEPLEFGPGVAASGSTTPAWFRSESQLQVVVRPRTGTPWVFGLHQCSYARVWTAEEKRLFQAIGQRIGDALSALLTLRDLRESEQHFRVLVEEAADAICVHDVDGRFVEVNPRLCTMVGYTRDEMLNMRVWEVDPRARSFPEDLWRPMPYGEPVSFESLLHRKDGSTFPVDIHIRPIEIRGQKLIVASSRDITERKQADEQRQAHLRFLEGMERVSQAIQSSTDPEQMMNDVLDEVLSIFGCDRAWLLYPCDPDSPTWSVPMERARPEWPGAGSMDTVFPMDSDIAEGLRLVLASGGPIQFGPGLTLPLSAEVPALSHIKSQIGMAVYPKIGVPWVFGLHQCSHTRVWTSEEERLFEGIGRRIGDALSVLLTLRDLRESEQRFRTLVEQSADGIALADLDSRFVEVNPRFCADLGYTREELLGMHITDITLRFASPEEANHYWQSLPPDEAVSFETQQRRKDGSIFPVEVRICPIEMHGRGLILGGVRDITERKRAEEEREKLEAQLRQSQKMEAVGQLAGGVAHDFNNILTAILGNVELSMDSVRDALGPDHNVLESMVQIEEAAKRASALTRQLLTFSRRDVIQPRALNLNRTLADLDKMLRRLVTENVVLEIATDPQLHSIWADAGRMEQMIVNLVVNAVQAMPDGGRLSLETQNVILDKDYTRSHPDSRPSAHVLLAVSDTGHGMDAETRERIFEPFFTTKTVDRGTGLGLATVHGIVQQSGGHITVHSEPGRGTTFKIYLPAIGEAGAEQPLASVPDAAPGGHETILLCEDDRPVRALIAETLRRAGYAVLTAASGREGIAMAEAHQQPIDLLVTDVIMPDMNGRALSRRLIEMRPGLPTLFISGYTADVIAHHGVLDEGIGFLEKPFTQQGLLSRVRDVLDKPRANP